MHEPSRRWMTAGLYRRHVLAGLGAGLLPDLEALRRIVGTTEAVHPDVARAAAWDGAYRQWRASTEAVLGLSGSRGGFA